MGCATRSDSAGCRLTSFLPPPPPPALQLLLLILALPGVTHAQWTTQLRCTAGCASAICYAGSSCDRDASARAQLAGVVSVFRESEARSSQLGLDLTAAVERYRANVTEQSKLAVRAARNACDSRAAELQASTQAAEARLFAAANRLAANASEGLRKAAEERVALGRRAHDAEEVLRLHNLTLHAIERSLKQTRTELNTTTSDVITNERQQYANMDALRLRTLAGLALIEDRLNSTNTELNEYLGRLSLKVGSLNDSLLLLGDALRHDIQASSITAASKLLSVQSELLSNVSSLARATEYALHSTNQSIKVSSESIAELFTIAERQGHTINHINETLQRSEASWKEQASTLDAQLNLIRSDLQNNLSLLSNGLVSTLNYSSALNMASETRISKLFTLADEQKLAINQLNRTQVESEVNWSQRTSSLRAELNATKLEFERLRDQYRRLRDDYEQLVTASRNMSAQLRACPGGWQRNGSSCYFLVSGWNGTWSDARGRCKVLAADFVAITNPVVNVFLSEYMSTAGVNVAWLGATDEGSEGTWRWITGEIFYSTSQRRAYANFAVGEPNNNYYGSRAAENCLIMTRSGSWNDVPCALTLAFFCQMHKP